MIPDWVFVTGGALAAMLGLMLAFRVYFRRDPERDVPGGDVIVSPADGRIISICDVGDGADVAIRKGLLGKVRTMCADLGEGRFTLVSVFMNLTNVHVNRSPIAGRVLSVTHRPGRFRPAWGLDALENETTETVIHSAVGRVKVLQIAGLVARRIENWLSPDHAVRTGERIGLIHFGSQVSLILPCTDRVAIRVSEGQRVRAGETVLAEFTPAPEAESLHTNAREGVPDGHCS